MSASMVVPPPECCAIADLRHHGRGGRMHGHSSRMRIRSSNPFAALIAIGAPKWEERKKDPEERHQCAAGVRPRWSRGEPASSCERAVKSGGGNGQDRTGSAGIGRSRVATHWGRIDMEFVHRRTACRLVPSDETPLANYVINNYCTVGGGSPSVTEYRQRPLFLVGGRHDRQSSKGSRFRQDRGSSFAGAFHLDQEVREGAQEQLPALYRIPAARAGGLSAAWVTSSVTPMLGHHLRAGRRPISTRPGIARRTPMSSSLVVRPRSMSSVPMCWIP